MKIAFEAFKLRLKKSHPKLFNAIRTVCIIISIIIAISDICIGIAEIVTSNFEPNVDLIVGILLILSSVIILLLLDAE